MTGNPESIENSDCERLAAERGVAIAFVDPSSHEAAVFNNNSICRELNPSGGFSPECARFCGRAFEQAQKAGESVSYECHAGLECRALPVSKRLVAIVGRTFVRAENYRKATERAMSGDWSSHSPTDFFENVLLASAPAVLDETAKRIAELAAKPRAETNAEIAAIKTPPAEAAETAEKATPAGRKEEPVETATSSEAAKPPVKRSPGEIADLADRVSREIRREPEAAKPPAETSRPEEHRTAQAGAWRSFFGSLLKKDYAAASAAILEFLATQYGFSALIWLERRDGAFMTMATHGEMKNRRVRLGLDPEDHRLVEAARSEMPLELGERARDGGDNTRTMYMFPIGIGGEVTAAIAVLDQITDEARKKQLARMCLSLAPQLEILRLRSEVARRESLSGAVRRFSDSIRRIDTDDFWLRVTQNAAEMVRAERASLMIYDEREEMLETKAIIGARHEFARGAGGRRVAHVVFEKGEPVIISDVTKTGLPPAPEREYKTASFMSCPVTLAGRTIGVMNFTDRACGLAFDKAALDLFEAVAPQLAVAIDRATLKHKAGEFEQLSVTDPLTGLLNRRYIEARLMEEIKRSNRHGFPMSFLMLDVDHFKSYNDKFGHPAGDDALKIVANVIRETLRGADVAARFGGEEFSILLPQTTDDEAVAIAGRIRHNIEHAEFPHRRVTVSIGVASCSAELCVSADLVSAADRALYEAKRQGRNRVFVFETSSESRVE